MSAAQVHVEQEVTNSVPPEILAPLVSAIDELMAYAEILGIVATIQTRPLQPLAMGNYAMHCELRKARVAACAV